MTLEEEDYDDDQEGAVKPKEQCAFKYVVKRNNNFMCLTAKTLKIVDTLNYMATGFSHSKCLAAFQNPEQKSVFCYEHIKALKQ